MGTADRVGRLGERLFALSREFTEDGNERRFLVHASLLELLSLDPNVRACATPVDHLRDLMQASYRRAQKLCSELDRPPMPTPPLNFGKGPLAIHARPFRLRDKGVAVSPPARPRTLHDVGSVTGLADG